MIRSITLAGVAVGIAMLTLPVFAGDFTSFEADLRAAYGDYRAALVQTSLGNAEGTDKALTGFGAKWTALTIQWRETPPPQYVDDAEFSDTMAKVQSLLTEAKAIAAGGDLAKAHLTLEAVREALGDLHIRNGLYTFSDRMNAYHEKMEVVLGKDYQGFSPEGLGMLREDAAVLAELAQVIFDHPAPEAAVEPYDLLTKGLKASIDALGNAARSGDAPAAKAAIGGLKPAYAKLFAKFG